MIKNIVLVLGGVLVLLLLWALPVAAQRPGVTAVHAPAAPLNVSPAEVAFTLLSGSVAWMDKNNACAAVPEGPQAMWLGLSITNTAAITLTGVVADLSGFSLAHYALTADPSRYVGDLAPGESYYGYWYVDYSGACPNPFNNRTDQYTLTVTADNLSAPATYMASLTTQSTQSVGQGAGSIITSSFGSDIAVGQIFTQVAQYQFPNNANGILIQPTGNADFTDTCFRLVDVEVTASTVPGISAGVRHQLYFPDAESANNKDAVTVVYFWQAYCQAEATSAPWWTSTEGQAPRYAKNYGWYFTTFPTASLSLSITSAITPTRLTQADVVTYTVRFANTFTQPVELNSITVTLANGLSFNSFVTVTSNVLPDNSSLYPAPNMTGTLVWRGKPGLSYSVPASTTQGPGELALIFKVNVPGVNGIYTQQARGQVGKMDVGVTSDDVRVDLPTAITLASFAADAQEDAILVTWETAMELDHVGFNLYRSTAAAGPYTKLNTAIIAPQFPGEVMGGHYEWLDTDVQPGVTYYYKLEDLDLNAARTLHGPVKATVRSAPAGGARFTVFLPLVLSEQ